jgi:hypothetical protein
LPAVSDAGVPLSIPAELKVTPLGNVPTSLKVGAGKPVAVTVKLPACPTGKVALFALVIAGAWPTVSVKFCVAAGLTPLLAVIVIGNVPVTVGVPLSAPVAEFRVTPFGSAPVSLNVGAGKPVAVTVKEPAWLMTKLALLTLVMAGAWFTVRVNACVAFEPTPFAAVNVMG